MKEYLFKYWFRKQKFIEEYRLFKYSVYALLLILYMVCTIIIRTLCSIDNIFERFFIMNAVSMIFTFYNLPTVMYEINTDKSNAILQMEGNLLYCTFCYLKRNILILSLIGALLSNFIYALIGDIKSCYIILLTIILQFELLIFDMLHIKEKIVVTCDIILLVSSIYFNFIVGQICALLAAFLYLSYKKRRIFRGKSLGKKHNDAFNN